MRSSRLTPVILDLTDLQAIQAPVLVMSGDRDFTPLEHSIEIYRGLPGGQLCVRPATGHATMWERPDDFSRLVRSFLERAAPRSL